MSDERGIEDLIEASSLGTAEAKAARESVPAELGVALALVAAHHPAHGRSGCCCGHWSYRGHMARLIADALAGTRRKGAAEHRHEWADYIDNWSASVGPEPPSVESIVAALRRDEPPFGVSAAGATP